jgi:uncharacterized protein involved in oxidation of intracellular sulfur
MKTLLLFNDPPYGTERSYNGLRLAMALAGKGGQRVPPGYYNLELMVKSVTRKGEVLLCGSCMDARGLTEEELVEGAKRSTMDELAARTIAADRVLVF